MKKSKEKITSYKRAFKSLQTYEKSKRMKKEKEHEYTESILKSLAKFMTKKGGLKKSAVRSQKAIKEFNALLNKYKTSGMTSAKGRAQRVSKEQYKKEYVARYLYKKGEIEKSQIKSLSDTFASEAVQYLMDKVGLTSSQVYALATDYSENYMDILDVASEIKRRIEYDVPERLKESIKSDDFYTLIDEYMQEREDGISHDDAFFEIFTEEDSE